jgi:hypothetical protein
VAVWAECLSKSFQLGMGERLVGKIQNLITQPKGSDLLGIGGG